MARARKTRYQFLRTVVLGMVVFVVLGALIGSFIQAALIFMLTGIISGTQVVIPVWGMALIYAGIIGGPTVWYLIDHPLPGHSDEQAATSQLAR